MKETDYSKDGIVQSVNPDYFTGKTRLAELSGVLGTSESKIYHVEFFKGAMTKLHRHSGAQLLVVTSGTGRLVTFERAGRSSLGFKIKETERIRLKKGGIAYVPPGVLHSHGSAGTRTFSHMAINFFPSKNTEPKTVWYESDLKSRVTGTI